MVHKRFGYAVPLPVLLILPLANGWAVRRGCEKPSLLQSASLPVCCSSTTKHSSSCYTASILASVSITLLRSSLLQLAPCYPATHVQATISVTDQQFADRQICQPLHADVHSVVIINSIHSKHLLPVNSLQDLWNNVDIGLRDYLKPPPSGTDTRGNT